MVYNLTAQDVLHTRLLLSTFDLPSEVIDIILDSAAYWALISCHRSEEVIIRADHPASALVDGAQSEGVLPWYSEHKYLSLEIPANEGTRVRMVKFRLRSSDQGRSNNATCRGTYNSSSSWFSLAVEAPSSTPSDRANAALESPQMHHPRWFLQSNVHGARNRRTHEIVWASTEDAIAPSQCDRELAPGGIDAKETEKEEQRSPTGGPGDEFGGRDEKTGSGTGLGFCQAVDPGSTISLYACAQYSGWENHVWCAEAEVYCLV